MLCSRRNHPGDDGKQNYFTCQIRSHFRNDAVGSICQNDHTIQASEEAWQEDWGQEIDHGRHEETGQSLPRIHTTKSSVTRQSSHLTRYAGT